MQTTYIDYIMMQSEEQDIPDKAGSSLSCFDTDEKLELMMRHLRGSKYGLSASDIAKRTGLNRNTVSKYLQILVTLGQAEVRHVGPARIFQLSERFSISNQYLSALPDAAFAIDTEETILWANNLMKHETGVDESEIIGKHIASLDIALFRLLRETDVYTSALAGKNISPGKRIYFDHNDDVYRVGILPTVFYDGTPGVLVIIERKSMF